MQRITRWKRVPAALRFAMNQAEGSGFLPGAEALRASRAKQVPAALRFAMNQAEGSGFSPR